MACTLRGRIGRSPSCNDGSGFIFAAARTKPYVVPCSVIGLIFLTTAIFPSLAHEFRNNRLDSRRSFPPCFHRHQIPQHILPQFGGAASLVSLAVRQARLAAPHAHRCFSPGGEYYFRDMVLVAAMVCLCHYFYRVKSRSPDDATRVILQIFICRFRTYSFLCGDTRMGGTLQIQSAARIRFALCVRKEQSIISRQRYSCLQSGRVPEGLADRKFQSNCFNSRRFVYCSCASCYSYGKISCFR